MNANTRKSEPLLSCCQLLSFFIEGICGRRRQGLDHTQLKHLKDVLHNEIVSTF